MLWLALGFLIGSLVEWLAHRYLLHSVRFKSISHSHFKIHHRNCRQQDGYDSDYIPLIPARYDHGWSEILFLVVGIILALPTVYLSFWLWFALLVHAFLYYYLHRKFHMETEWGRKWMPWHWDHHMGKNQNANWGVTNPIFDWVFKTRTKDHETKLKR